MQREAGLVRVMIVEDDPTTRSRLATMIDAEPDMAVCAVAGDVAEGRKLLERRSPDVLLTDLGLPDGSGLDLIRLAHRDLPRVEIMVITVFADEPHVLSAIEAGATGYLLKDGTASYVAGAIRELLDGGAPISPSIARQLLRRYAATRPDEARVSVGGPPRLGTTGRPQVAAIQLTPRETEVLRQIAKGFSYEEIGATLGLSVHTVTTHIKHLYRKLAVRSRGEAVFEAAQLGLISVGPLDHR